MSVSGTVSGILGSRLYASNGALHLHPCSSHFCAESGSATHLSLSFDIFRHGNRRRCQYCRRLFIPVFQFPKVMRDNAELVGTPAPRARV